MTDDKKSAPKKPDVEEAPDEKPAAEAAPSTFDLQFPDASKDEPKPFEAE